MPDTHIYVYICFYASKISRLSSAAMAHLLPRPRHEDAGYPSPSYGGRADELSGYGHARGGAQLPLRPSTAELQASRAASSSSGAQISDSDLLCAEFLTQVRLRTREGYEEALRLSERILEIEPNNQLVLEYQSVIHAFLESFGELVDEAHAEANDPNRTPSEVSTDDSEEDIVPGVDDDQIDEVSDAEVSEVATEPPTSPR